MIRPQPLPSPSEARRSPMRRLRRSLPGLTGILALLLALAALGRSGEAREAPVPGARDWRAVTAAVDAAIDERLAAAGVRPAPDADDGEFLRRLTLDLLGTVPTVAEVEAFLADRDPGKRSRKIAELMASEAYAESQASWWYRTLTGLSAHAGRPREGQGGRFLAGTAGQTFHRWLSEQIATNRPYDEMVRDLIAATGRTDENGATGYLARWEGNANNTAGAVAKHFLGVRIQCAQCHDHMYEPDWKQKDFQGMAAFFALTTTRRVPEYVELQRLRRSMETKRAEDADGAMDGEDGSGGESMRADPAARAETARKLRELQAYRNVVEVRDAVADARQLQRARRFMNAERVQANPELKARLELAAVTPKLWLASEAPDLPGIPRRELLARWVTSKDNPLFARTLVNRMWGAFMGRGFVDPVDDFNSFIEPSHPALLELLAQDFVASGYDLQRLVRLLVESRTYQRTSRWEGAEAPDAALFAKAPVRPLDTEQLYFALVRATGMETQLSRASRRQGQQVQQAIFSTFSFVFDDDEGEEANDFQGSIPQGLFLMNGELLQRALAGTPGPARGRARDRARARAFESPLQRLLREEEKDGARVDRLYLHAYARHPEAEERRAAVRFVKARGGAVEAYEDLFWALLNAAEFMTNH